MHMGKWRLFCLVPSHRRATIATDQSIHWLKHLLWSRERLNWSKSNEQKVNWSDRSCVLLLYHVDAWAHLCRLLGAVWCSAKKKKKTTVSWPFFQSLTFKHKLNIVADQAHPFTTEFPFSGVMHPTTVQMCSGMVHGTWRRVQSDPLNFPRFPSTETYRTSKICC